MAHSSTDRMRWRTSLAVAAFDEPDRRQDFQYVGRVDLGDGPAPDAGEGLPFHAPPPVLRVPPAAPAAALLLQHPLGSLGEGGNALGAALSRRAGRRRSGSGRGSAWVPTLIAT